MIETLGWVCLGGGALCGIAQFIVSAKHMSSEDPFDRRSYFEREAQRSDEAVRSPASRILIVVGLGLFVLGFWLLSTTAKQKQTVGPKVPGIEQTHPNRVPHHPACGSAPGGSNEVAKVTPGHKA